MPIKSLLVATAKEAFKHHHSHHTRLPSLHADFGQRLEINPEGYHANVAVWIKALANASQAGLTPTQLRKSSQLSPYGMRGSTHDLLNTRNRDELARALQYPHHGRPTCLTAVFNKTTQKKEMILRKDFLHSKESIYKISHVLDENADSSSDGSTYKLIGDGLLGTSGSDARTQSIAATNGPTSNDALDFICRDPRQLGHYLIIFIMSSDNKHPKPPLRTLHQYNLFQALAAVALAIQKLVRCSHAPCDHRNAEYKHKCAVELRR
ncbi:hypothetical protein NX059_012204 [Plenodomus lindquistii]|nr:hypothetical protein NX059_012204 [Plenodomus lindquistii]